MSTTITPRTVEVVIYQGDDLAKLRELYEATEFEASAQGPARVADTPVNAAHEKAEAYDAFVTEAAERAVSVTIQQVGRKRWRDVRDAHPARKDNETDALFGYDSDAVAEDLMPESIIAPVFKSTTDRDTFLDSLSDADWQRLTSALIGVNTTQVGDPKALRLVSLVDQMSGESSKPPERLA